jgi:chloramphenicol O-acetyltransferase type A
VGVTQNVDVTELVNFCREKKYSFYLTFLHAAALAADEVPQLRQRIHEGGIVEYDACPTSHIELLEDETYCYCTLRHHMPLEEYIPYAEAMREKCRQKASIEEDDDVESMYFISSLPWLHYSAMIQPTAGGEDSNPRITWGRYEKDIHGRLQMPVTLLAHHSLADGIHIAKFYQNLIKKIGQLTV